MNSQELRNLQEAYLEVVINEGDVDSPYDRAQTNRADAYRRAQTNRADAYRRAQKKKKEKTQKEETDLYDLILSHLLDEGYADTQEGAEVIMVNMSEDWRESIMEKRYEPNEKLPGSGLSPNGKFRRKRKEFLKHSKDIYQGSNNPMLIHPDDQKETGRQRAQRMTRNYNIGRTQL